MIYKTMDKVMEIFKNYRNQIYIAGLVIVIVVVLYLVYRRKPVIYTEPQPQSPLPLGQDVPQEQDAGSDLDGGGREPVKVILFFAPWCSHCKHFMSGPDSVWEKLKQKHGHKVKFEEVNCDEKPDMATQFGIKGFPTILKLNKDKVEEFGGDRSLEVLEDFVHSE
jgi:thioredoxin 1